MYIVEINEDKMDNLIENMSKGIHCFKKAIDCLEEMKSKDHSREERNYDDEDYRYRNERNSGGRYSRY